MYKTGETFRIWSRNSSLECLQTPLWHSWLNTQETYRRLDGDRFHDCHIAIFYRSKLLQQTIVFFASYLPITQIMDPYVKILKQIPKKRPY